jgi:coniferyl-aldehyde dehydrogenase
MIKPSEYTPETSAAIQRLIGESFDPEEISVVTGGPDIGQAFSSLPFDHLLFTGATSIGRHVMRAAADNLTPVTLELGGKSPTIIGRDADLDEAAAKIVNGKLLNAGQACLAPDYVFVPEDRLDSLVSALGREYQSMYPDGPDSPDYTAIINDGHYQRLETLLTQIRDSGIRTEQFGQAGQGRCLPLTVVIDPPEDTQVMCDEIFGPILPIKPYREIDEVIGYVQSHERPLGLYYFGQNEDELRRVLDRTLAGGVTINDVMFHISVDDLPFGGVGASGMGAYHGIEGFRTFSHAKSVFRQSRVNLMALIGLIPPWGKKLEATLKREIRR